MDGVEPADVAAAKHAARAVPGVRAATVRGGWTGRTLRLEIEVYLAADLPLSEADAWSRRRLAGLPAARQVFATRMLQPPEPG
jgi:divalent metal cation (Fe/Co/Zn/Cd) transporter